MAQPPGSSPTTPSPDPEPSESPSSAAELPSGIVFHPNSRILLDHYLVPRALHGRVPDGVLQDAVAEGVDVYATRPGALPFPSRNIGRVQMGSLYRDQKVWGYFFATQPEATAEAAGFSELVRDVATGGRWCWCSHKKGYAEDDDGEAYAFRTRFAFYADDGKLTPWRMKEYGLNEGAARFRGVTFHPGAANVVVWKVYNKVDEHEVALEMPIVYYSSGDENEVDARKRIKKVLNQTSSTSMAQSPRCIENLPCGFIFHPRSRRLIDRYLIPQALHGRVPDDALQDAVAYDVDVHTMRPDALPFPSCNRRWLYRDQGVWGYFFTTRPATASSKYVRHVAAGGRWCWCGYEKGYADEDGEVYAYRTRFAFYEENGKLTPWLMKEYRLNEGAARFRGLAFHPGATNLVLWKVYKEVESANEPRPTKYRMRRRRSTVSSSRDDDDNEEVDSSEDEEVHSSDDDDDEDEAQAPSC